MEKDFKTIQKIAFLVGCFLNYVDDLETNSLFKHQFKKRVMQLSNFLRKFEAHLLNVKDEKESRELSEQLHNSYLAIDNLVDIQFSLKNDVYFFLGNNELLRLQCFEIYLPCFKYIS